MSTKNVKIYHVDQNKLKKFPFTDKQRFNRAIELFSEGGYEKVASMEFSGGEKLTEMLSFAYWGTRSTKEHWSKNPLVTAEKGKTSSHRDTSIMDIIDVEDGLFLILGENFIPLDDKASKLSEIG